MVEKSRKSLIWRCLAAALIIFMSLSGVLCAQGQVKVAIIPFTMNADRDLGFLQRGIGDMLATRLAWGNQVVIIDKHETAKQVEALSGPVDAAGAKKIGENLGADFVLFGSLTVFGNSVSLDATMSDVKGEKPPITVFNQSRGMDDVIPTVNNFAQDINAKIFGRGTAVTAAPTAPVIRPAAPAAPGSHAHPDTLIPSLGAGTVASGGPSPFVSRTPQAGASPFIQSGGVSSGFWKSPNFKEDMQGLAVADIDGDGLNETVFIGENNVFVRRNQQGRFIAISGFEGQRHQRYMWVDAADVNGNGRAEIFISAINGSTKRAESLVLEWNNGELEVVAEKQKWYYAVVAPLGQTPTLYGQRGGSSTPLIGGVFELYYEAGEYVKGAKISAPEYLQVFGFNFINLENNQGRMIVGFDRDDDLKLFSLDGKKDWSGDESMGGSHKFFKIPGEKGSGARIYLSQRIAVTDLNADKQPELIVVKNKGSAGRIFKRYRKYTSAEFASLAWDGLGFGEIWRTRKISGYVADFTVADFDNDGQPELVAAVVQSAAIIGGHAKSSIISYDLGILGGKGK